MAYNTKNILRSGDASPIPIPQFYNPTEDAFNPLTGANLGSGRYGADGVMWGKTAGGVYIPVQVNANGEVLTQLSGRKVEETIIFNALAVTATGDKYTTVTGLDKYKSFDFIVTNTLDKPIRIVLKPSHVYGKLIKTDGTVIDYAPYIDTTAHLVPAGVVETPLSSFPIAGVQRPLQYQDYKYATATFVFRPREAPTSGSVTIKLLGVLN